MNWTTTGQSPVRDFTAARSDPRWVADISWFGCDCGRLYLAGIRDLHDHTLVGWPIGEPQTTDLVVAALVMVLGRRNPAGEFLHHADYG
jgi:transposase InsO family protein